MTFSHKVGKLSMVALLSVSLSAQLVSSVAFAEESSSVTSSATKKEDAMNDVMVAQFKGKDKFKVEGTAKLTDKELTLTNFSSDEAPDLHAYLTKDGDIENGVELGKVDHSKKVQSIKLDKVDASKYNTVTIYCKQAHEVFGNGTLMKFSELKADNAMKKMGEFKGENDKMVSGNVEIEKNTLKLSNFKTDKGPDLHVLLTKDGNIDTAVEVGALDLEKAEQSFDLNGLMADGYNQVTIYCVEAHAVFGSAALK